MSLYGIDILITKDGDWKIVEINGICSGMRGFQQIYGDNRVEDRVHAMLQSSKGVLTVNDGTYWKQQPTYNLRRRIIQWAVQKYYFPENINTRLRRHPILSSDKAFTEWLTEERAEEGIMFAGFPTYTGQPSTVINLVNELVPDPTVNPYVVEEITRNKFLQYAVLRKTDLGKRLVPTILVGLGFTSKKELSDLCEKYGMFVLKPTNGYQGKGIRILSREEALALERTAGHTHSPTPREQLLQLLGKASTRTPEYLVKEGFFAFESGTAVLQPFIQTKNTSNKTDTFKNTSIRAIICNLEFVDAYARASNNPVVNLSSGATAVPYHATKKFKRFCEHIAQTLEQTCAGFDKKTFRKDLYMEHLATIRSTPYEQVFEMFMRMKTPVF